MEIKLSDHFTLGRLIKFVLPSIVMMIFTSIYGVVDGFFISNLIGDIEFSAVNYIMPFPMLLSAIGFMIGAGGSAVVSIKLGEKQENTAREVFSMLIKVVVIVGVILSILGFIFIEDIALMLGSSETMLPYCVTYGSMMMIALTFFMLQNTFQSFLVVAGKPKLGLFVTIIAGVTNIVLDYLFMGPFNMGVFGAALATSISQIVGGIVPLIFFCNKNNGTYLYLVKSRFNFKYLWDTCFNGSSELLTNISFSLVSMLYNAQLMKYVGESGVAAYGVIMYVGFIFVAVFIGYSIGTAPIVSYHYGAENYLELKNVFRKSLIFNIFAGICMMLLSLLSTNLIAQIYVGYDEVLLEMTKESFYIYSFAFLFIGVNIYASSFFTSLGNGVLSAILSVLRTLILQVVCVLILPLIFDVSGIWYSLVVAELIAIIISIITLMLNKKKYNY